MKKAVLAAGIISVATGIASANIWTGSGSDNYYLTGANWQEGSAPGWLGTGTFSGDATSMPNPDINGAVRNGNALDFQTSGWVLSDSVGTGAIRVDGGLFIKSSGAGVNHLNANITTSGGSATSPVAMNIGAGNTLRISKTFTPSYLDFGSSSGTLVFDGSVQQGSGSYTSVPWTVPTAMTMLANTTGAGSLSFGNFLSYGRLGGTGTIVGFQYQTSTIGAGGVLAPGGNGEFGDEIGTLTIQSSSDVNRHNLVLDTDAIFEAQLGSMLGSNDKLIFDSYGNGKITINGATLNLQGEGAIADGTYTIIENLATDMADISGTFSTVLYNGAAVDSENFTVNYNGDSITVDIFGVVPEPVTLGLMSVGGLFTLLIRRLKR